MVGLEIEKKKAKKRQACGQGGVLLRQNLAEPNEDEEKGKALEKVAKNAGSNYETARQYKHILEAVREKEVLEDGRTINAVFKDLRKEGKIQYAHVEFPRDKYRILGWKTNKPLRDVIDIPNKFAQA